MLVVGGIGRSKGVAFSPSMGFPAVASEHTTNGRIGTLHSAVHSLSGCDTSAIEGARNRTALPGPACSSAIRSDINVLPVPQARLVVSSRDVSCGFEVRIGERIGVLLREDGGWRSGLCSQLDADVLLRAAAPLPTPTSDGPRYWTEHGEIWALPAGSRSPTQLASFDTPLLYGALPVPASAVPEPVPATSSATTSAPTTTVIVTSTAPAATTTSTAPPPSADPSAALADDAPAGRDANALALLLAAVSLVLLAAGALAWRSRTLRRRRSA